jgi:hypothetical protein
MASVTFDTVVGGDGSTVTDDDSPSTGLGNGGALLRLVPMMAQSVAVAETVVTAATSVVGGATTNATSTTSLLIGTGSKTFTTQSGKAFVVGQYVIAASTTTPSNYMIGQVTSYSTTTLILNVIKIGGSGTIANWTISVTGEPFTGNAAPDFLLINAGII